jgi:hypothetical protein
LWAATLLLLLQLLLWLLHVLAGEPADGPYQLWDVRRCLLWHGFSSTLLQLVIQQ